MKAHGQRNAHHLKRARLPLGCFGQFELADVAHLSQQLRLARFTAFVVGIGHFAVPSDDLGISFDLQIRHTAPGSCASLQALHFEVSLHVAQGHWQQRKGRCTRFSKPLHHAKAAGCKLGQRWLTACFCGQRKRGGVVQGATRGIDKAFGQFNPKVGVFCKRAFECDAAQGVVVTITFVDLGLEAVFGAFEHNALGHLAGHGCVKAQAHAADGQAGGLGVLALASEAGFERFAHFVVKALFYIVSYAAGGCHAFAIHHTHGAGRV